MPRVKENCSKTLEIPINGAIEFPLRCEVSPEIRRKLANARRNIPTPTDKQLEKADKEIQATDPFEVLLAGPLDSESKHQISDEFLQKCDELNYVPHPTVKTDDSNVNNPFKG